MTTSDGQPPALLIPPPPFLFDPALTAVLAALPGARLVGGCVRDALLGQPSADIDLATPQPPDAVMAALSAAGLRAVPTGLAHGTVTAVSNGRGFEVTTLRRDEETDGRHARVAWTADWRADAARRDFTFNALSLRWAPDEPGGDRAAVFDYFDGVADLQAGRVRFVGDPAARVAEDRLRVLRFFRFYARFGTQPPAPDTVAALRGGVPDLPKLSAERVWSELKRILGIPDPGGAVALMAELGVLPAVLPEGADPARLRQLIASGAPADPLLRLAGLVGGDPAALAARLKLSVAERDTLAALATAPSADPDMDDDALRRLLVDWPAPVLAGRTWLEGGTGPAWDALRARLNRLPRPRFPLAGRDALALGVPPGPRVGELLAAVRSWWLDGGCTAAAAACRAELAARLSP